MRTRLKYKLREYHIACIYATAREELRWSPCYFLHKRTHVLCECASTDCTHEFLVSSWHHAGIVQGMGPKRPSTGSMSARATANLMLEAKNTRKRAEADVHLLANRLAHLQAEEEKAKKKTEETKQVHCTAMPSCALRPQPMSFACGKHALRQTNLQSYQFLLGPPKIVDRKTYWRRNDHEQYGWCTGRQCLFALLTASSAGNDTYTLMVRKNNLAIRFRSLYIEEHY